jgi:class 3 adenylate cyclase
MPHRLSLDQFRELHPWKPAQRALGRPREWLWMFDLPVAPADAWRTVGDTERTNRATGLTTMHYKEVEGELHGWHVTAGVRHEFVERWEWVADSTIELVREYRAGFARVLRTAYRFDPGPGGSGTRLHVYYGWITRGTLGSLAVRVGMHFYARRYHALVERIRGEMQVAGAERASQRTARADAQRVARASGQEAIPRAQLAGVMARPGHLEPEPGRRVARLRDQLRGRGVDADALEQIVKLAESGDDIDLDRIRVRRLAREWRLDERRVIRTALHATRAGLLQLTWDVLCPHCRGVRRKLATLGEVPERGACEACAVEFGTDGEHAIEVTFRVHPSIRAVPDAVYCSAQPMRRGHIRLQQQVGGGEARELPGSLGPGRYRLRVRGRAQVALLDVVADQPPGQTIEWSADAAPSRAEVGPEPVFVLRAPTGEETFVVEEEQWDDDALLPVHLFNMQDFRDLFSEEYLAAGVRLYVGEQTILFSDIVGSTRLYAETGDPGAFIEVKRHFAKIYERVAAHSGVVVKTIGDAVMAAFSDPKNAIAAAHDIHLGFPGASGAGSSVRLRISIHTGPCIAVNLNSGIDYFGGTVNTAAKLQRCAGAGEAALSEAVQRAPGVAEALREYGGALRREVLEHEALGRLPVAVWVPGEAKRDAAGSGAGSALSATGATPAPAAQPATREANPATASASPASTSAARRPELAGTRKE